MRILLHPSKHKTANCRKNILNLLEIKEIVNRCKWVENRYEHIYTMNNQTMNEWDTGVGKWDTYEEKWDVMSQFSTHVYNTFTYSIITMVNNI